MMKKIVSVFVTIGPTDLDVLRQIRLVRLLIRLIYVLFLDESNQTKTVGAKSDSGGGRVSIVNIIKTTGLMINFCFIGYT